MYLFTFVKSFSFISHNIFLMMDHTGLVRNVKYEKTNAMNPEELSHHNKSYLTPKQGPNKDTGNKSDQQQPTKHAISKVKEVDIHVTSFNIEHELRRIKIHVALTELMKNDPFKISIMKVLKPPASAISFDVISLQDENLAITVGPHIEDGSDASTPFYISLNVHEQILHNFLKESRASHNAMPKVVMEELGLEITKPYQQLYSFYSKKVKCLGLIKDLVVSLSQLLMKSVVMDIVVSDIPPKYDMLLSRF